MKKELTRAAGSRRGWMLRRLGAPAVLAAGLALAVAGNAAASSVEVRQTDPDVPQLGELVITGDPGEANAITVDRVGVNFVITDTGAVLDPGPGCSRGADDHTARCGTSNVFELFVSLGDGNDSIADNVALR